MQVFINKSNLYACDFFRDIIPCVIFFAVCVVRIVNRGKAHIVQFTLIYDEREGFYKLSSI